MNNENTSLGTQRGANNDAYLTPLMVIALSFGYVVGWGAFVMPGTKFLPSAGPVGTGLGLLLGAFVISILAYNYHRLTVCFPGPRGTYGFVTNMFGYDHGFVVAWFLLLTYVAILWANAGSIVLLTMRLFGDVFKVGFHYTIAGLDVYLSDVLTGIVVVASCGGLCLCSKRLAVWFHVLLSVVLVGGVVICFAAALCKHEGGLASMAPAFAVDENINPPLQVLRILAMIPWAFVGFEAVVHSSGEFRFPVKRLFSLMVVAIGISALMYLCLALLPVLALPEGISSWASYIEELPGLEGIHGLPVFEAAQKVLGKTGLAIISVAMLAAQLTALFAGFIATSRLMSAMADDNMLPAWFGYRNKDGNSVHAILFVMCISFAVRFFGRTVIGWPVDVSNLGAVIAYGYTSAVALKYARKAQGGETFAKAAGLFGIVLSVIFGLLTLVPNYLSGISFSTEAYLLLAIWCILGFIVYRRMFLHDKQGLFGNSIVVWITVLIMIFFSSLMWFRLAVCDSAERAQNDLVGKIITEESVSGFIAGVSADMLFKSIVELCILVASLAIMLNLFSILRHREKDLIVEKLKAEESANKSKSYFFSTVSHDIRTPLNAIIGFSQMLKMGFKTEAEREQAVNMILISSKTLLCLINDLLDFSKLEDGRMEIVPEPTDCPKLLGEIVESFRIANKKPSLEFRSQADEMPTLLVDPQRLRQILFNLVGNAAKFTQEGFVEVRLSYVRDRGADTGTFRLDVEDSGCGISDEDMKRIASPYVQVRSKLARHGGTGLGLAICQQLAQAMGGELTIASTLGKGSTFTITLPGVKVSDLPPVEEHTPTMDDDVTEAKDQLGIEAAIVKQQDLPTEMPSQDAGLRRILVVDDQKMNLMVLKAMLKKLGSFEVVTALDGKEALEILQNSTAAPFERVLTDMWMPHLDGAGLVRAIRAEASLSALPVHVVTADVEMQDKYQEHGFTGLLLKPVTVKKLKEVMENPAEQ